MIGEPLPAEKITARAGARWRQQGAAGNWRAAAEAIMTTDTYPKLATATAMIDGIKVTINGIAKGSGMIAPDMATMLSFVFTDANLPASVLQELPERRRGALASIPSPWIRDTSTSDTLLLFATGKGAQACRHHQGERQAADRFPQQAGCACCWIWRCRWSRTAKARRS